MLHFLRYISYIGTYLKNITPNFIFLQINFHEDRIPFILLNAQIFLCYAVGGMIKHIHQKSRRDALLPGMVAKSFAQGVTADMRGMQRFLRSFFHNTEGLGAA